MKLNLTLIYRVGTTLLLSCGALIAVADEGMWLFTDLPKKHLQEKYGFEPTDEWAKHVMLSSVRFNSGGSASFVSSNGLVLTNHHVGAGTIQKLSTPENNYYKYGFAAKTADDEIKAPDLELNQLVSIDDVTDRVNAAVQPDMAAAQAFVARRAIMSEIEKESLEKTGLRSNVITLYGGARYHLYRYKKYTDVRLVWAPESDTAFFGGDADNFEYPRYCLDVCLFRVYEDDKPARIRHFLKVSKNGAAKNELVFVSGNPGRTQRIFTTAALKYQRDHYLPYVLNFLHRREILFQQFGLETDEKKRRAKDDLFGIQNARKAYTGMIQGLQDPAFLKKKQQDERAFLKKIRKDPQLQKYADAWSAIENAQEQKKELLGQTASFSGSLFDIASTLVFMAAEDQKPNNERLREYTDAARASLEQQLYSSAPIYPDLEHVKLADSLALFVERRGADHPLVATVLDGKSPNARASELIAGTKLMDIEYRKQVARGGQKSIDQSTDTLIRFAKSMENEARRLREIQDEIAETERQAYAQITDAQFAIQGTDQYPDATFTLRLAFGPVLGYEEAGETIPPWTTLAGAYQHEKNHGAKSPWKLPARWHERKAKLDLKTPFNFVCTADIIGGNSGSPVINRDAELVGVIFDGNIQSLTSDYFYTDKIARAVSVHSSIVLEALHKVYEARHIADQMGR